MRKAEVQRVEHTMLKYIEEHHDGTNRGIMSMDLEPILKISDRQFLKIIEGMEKQGLITSWFGDPVTYKHSLLRNFTSKIYYKVTPKLPANYMMQPPPTIRTRRRGGWFFAFGSPLFVVISLLGNGIIRIFDR